MTTTIQAPSDGSGQERERLARIAQPTIEGRFRPISTHQLALIWWLHIEGQITRRQLRITFAAHELHERRRYTAPEHRGCAHYRTEELASLVGGRGSETALRALRTDVRHLAAIGLVEIGEKAIRFAESAEQLTGDLDLSRFWDFFSQLPNRNRTVPVPRRTLRALAAGFSRAVTGVMLAMLLRSVFWKRTRGGGGEYTTDGRAKLAWIASTFSLSRRAVTDARAHLIELGWLEPMETHQWERNRWGVRDIVRVDWSHKAAAATEQDREQPSEQVAEQPAHDPDVENPAGGGRECAGESASPHRHSEGESASPINRSALPTGDLKTRKLGATTPDLMGSWERRKKRAGKDGAPNIRDIRPEDLADTERLFDLHGQALALGMNFEGELGELHFLALANRARTRGQRPAALFFDLISNHRIAFITIADEEDGRRRQAMHRHGDQIYERTAPPEAQYEQPIYSVDEAIVLRCEKACPTLSPEELFRAARSRLPDGWTLERWERAHFSLRVKDARRWSDASDEMFDCSDGNYAAGALA